MALNVNILGKDSDGNLQALKVNSEGNLEISDSLGWGELLQDISDKLDSLADKLDSLIDILTSVSNTEEGFIRVDVQEPAIQET